MKMVVSMNSQGRLTVPAAAREALEIEGATQFELEVEGDALILRPALVIPREDAWAYTPEHLERVARARADAQAGRLYQMTEQDLLNLVRED